MGILSIFSKKIKDKPVILSVDTLVLELIKKNLEMITGNTPEIDLVQEKFANWQNYLTDQNSGYVLRFFRNATRSPLLVFFPSDFISVYIPSVSGKDLQSELIKFSGPIPAFLLPEIKQVIEPEPEPEPELVPVVDRVVKFGDNISLPGYMCSELKGKEEVLWQTSNSRIFKIRTGSVFIYLFLAENESLQFNNYCRDSEISLDLLKNFIEEDLFNNGSEASKGNPEIVSAKINNQAEFLAGRFFLPRIIKIGEHNAVSGIETISFEPEQRAEENGISFTLKFTIEDKPYSVGYHIPAKSESDASLSRMMQTLFKGVLPIWRRFFEIRNVGGGMRDLSTQINEQIKFRMNGGIKYKSSLIPVEIGLSEGIVSLLSLRFLESEVFIMTDLSRIISLNQSLLNIFLKDNLFIPMTLSEFFNLIDDLDLKKVIQNFFSGTGWNSVAVQSLFTYSIKVIEEKKIYYFQDPFFNRLRFFNFLPKLQKDEWKRTRGASGSKEEMVSSGRKALKEIYYALREDHLDLSFKSSIILRNEFKLRGERKIRKDLDSMMQNEPFSVLLENTFPRDVQNLLARLTAKVLSNALVLYTDNLGSLEPFMSRNYRTEVKALIKIIHRKSSTDGFDMDEIRDDLLSLHGGLKALDKEEDMI